MRERIRALACRWIEDRTLPWAALGIALVLAMLQVILANPQAIGPDTAMYLHCGKLLLEGQVPYVDFVELNPPWIFYLSTLPVLLARAFSLPPALASNLFTLGLLVLATAQIAWILRRGWPASGPAARFLPLIGWLLGSAWILYDEADWGQREHLFVLLAGPYLLLRAAVPPGSRLPAAARAAFGLQAGIGVALKPHFLAIVLAVEIARTIVTRRRPRLLSAQFLAFALVLGVYLLHWAAVPAAMRQEFFGRWVPLVRQGYYIYQSTWIVVFRKLLESNAATGALAAVTAAALILQRRTAGLLRLPLATLAWAAVASLAVFLLQKKGWSYQLLPFYVLGGTLAGMLAAGALRPAGDGPGAGRGPAPPAMGVFAAGAVMIPLLALSPARPDFGSGELAQAIEAYSAPGEGVLALSASVDFAYPTLVLVDRRPGSRYLWHFPIWLLAASAATPGGAEERRLAAELLADLETLRPRIVLIPAFASPELAFAQRNGLLVRVAEGWQKAIEVRKFDLYVRQGG